MGRTQGRTAGLEGGNVRTDVSTGNARSAGLNASVITQDICCCCRPSRALAAFEEVALSFADESSSGGGRACDKVAMKCLVDQPRMSFSEFLSLPRRCQTPLRQLRGSTACNDYLKERPRIYRAFKTAQVGTALIQNGY